MQLNKVDNQRAVELTPVQGSHTDVKLFEGGEEPGSINEAPEIDEKHDAVNKSVSKKKLKQNGTIQALSQSMKDLNQSEQQEFIDQITRESEPMKITDYMVDSPCKVICFSYLALIIFAMLTGAFGYMMPSLEGGRGRDYLIWKDPLQVNADKLTLAEEFLEATKGDAVVDLQTESTNFVFILYTNLGDHENGLLNKEALKKMKEMEDTIQNDADFKKFCLASKPLQEGDPPQCDKSKVLSAISTIIGDLDLETATQAELNENFKQVLKSPAWAFASTMYDKEVKPDNLKIRYMRSFFQNGGPLQPNETFRFQNASHFETEQTELLKDYLKAAKKTFDAQDTESFGFKAQFITFNLLISEILNILLKDFLLVIVSITVVFLWFCLHLKSSFLAIVGVSIIFLSFPFTAFIVSGIFRVGYFGYLQVIAIFLVCGIAADDIFVFIDAWKQSEHIAPEIMKDKNRRMAYAFRRGVRAMTVTSATTAAAFYANLFSPIMPIRAFGVFAGTLVPINFFLVVLMMPPAVIYYEEKLKYKSCCCCIDKRLPSGDLMTKENDPSLQVAGMDAHSKIDKFFDTTWNTFISKAKYVIVIITLIWFIVACYFTPQMGPQTEQPKFIADDNPVWQPIAIMSDEFPADSDGYSNVNIYFGVGEIDREGESTWDPDFIGDISFDDSFDMSTAAAQQFLKDMCADLKTKDFVIGEGDSFKCWITQFESFITRPVADPNPAQTTQMQAMNPFYVYIPGKEETFPVSEPAKFNKYIEEWLNSQEGKYQQPYVGFRQGKVIFTKVSGKVRAYQWNPSSIKQPLLDKWQAFVDEKIAIAPAEMKSMKQTSSAWIDIPSEKAFVKGAFQGIVTSICFSFFILMLVTRNFITSIVSIFCVTVIIFSIITFMHWNGQQFGSDESIAVVMLIGFAVDYVLHLGTDYMHSLAGTRFDKMKQSYREMGLSISSGCATTFLCGGVLFFGNLLFFQKFAMIICLTALMAYIMAMITFGAIMHIVGPEKDFCTIKCKK